MLHYELSKQYLDFLLTLSNKERTTVLWKSQSIFSMANGYLKMKIKDIDEDTAIFHICDNIYLLVYSDYTKIQFLNGISSKQIPEFNNFKENENILVSKSIKELLDKDDSQIIDDDFTKYLQNNYFTTWFIKLFSFVPSDYRLSFTKNNALPTNNESEKKIENNLEAEAQTKPLFEVETKLEKDDSEKEIVLKKPINKRATFAPQLNIIDINASEKKEPKKPINKPKQKPQIDGQAYERLILRQLEEAYKKRAEKKKLLTQKSPALNHVKFAPKEILISYTNKDSCLEKLLKKVKQNGCRLSDNDWLILLANTVDEEFAEELAYRYPEHVNYTDYPDKGILKIAFIVKLERDVSNKNDDLGQIKRVKSKSANFVSTLPSGAFENIDDEDYYEATSRPRNNTIRLVKSKVAKFEPKILENTNVNGFIDFDDFEYDENGFLLDNNLDEESSFDEINDNVPNKAKENYPKHWHCYLCGKKKLYSLEPAEIIKLDNNKTVYLCKKHKGKYK